MLGKAHSGKASIMAEYNVITPYNIKPEPRPSEQRVARIMAQYFQSDIQFVPTSSVSRTPDLFIVRLHQLWEIKNIRGNGKRTMANNLRTAQHQSENVIISLFETKMTGDQAVARARDYLKSGPVKIKHLIIITKSERVIEII